MTDRDIVERVGRLFGRAVVPLRARKERYKQPFATAIKGAPAVELMNSVRDFLGISRRTEIDRAVGSWHRRRRRWRRPNAVCSVEDCTTSAAVRGLCERHYDQWWKAARRGRPLSHLPLAAPSEHFGLVSASGCDDRCELAWLAGLLEGEGTFCRTGAPPQSYPVISVDMCDFDVVTRVARMLGSTVLRREPEEEAWSPTYYAKIAGHRAAEWMRRLRPLMGLRRGAAIDDALNEYHPIRLVDAPLTCVVEGCLAPHRSRGLCHKHYMSWSRDVKRGRVPRITPLR